MEWIMKEMSPADATRFVNALARGDNFSINLSFHAKKRLQERNLISGDVLYLLKNGFVHSKGQKADGKAKNNNDIFKYIIEGSTPNSNGRFICAAIIPAPDESVTILTVYWKDE